VSSRQFRVQGKPLAGLRTSRASARPSSDRHLEPAHPADTITSCRLPSSTNRIDDPATHDRPTLRHPSRIPHQNGILAPPTRISSRGLFERSKRRANRRKDWTVGADLLGRLGVPVDAAIGSDRRAFHATDARDRRVSRRRSVHDRSGTATETRPGWCHGDGGIGQPEGHHRQILDQTTTGPTLPVLHWGVALAVLALKARDRYHNARRRVPPLLGTLPRISRHCQQLINRPGRPDGPESCGNKPRFPTLVRAPNPKIPTFRTQDSWGPHSRIKVHRNDIRTKRPTLKDT